MRMTTSERRAPWAELWGATIRPGDFPILTKRRPGGRENCETGVEGRVLALLDYRPPVSEAIEPEPLTLAV